MALIEYDMRDNITERERIKSLKESVQRGFDEVSQSLEKKADKSNIERTGVSLSNIVATSEDNGWTVEKWSDGRMKAYKTITFSSLTFTAATGGGYANKTGNTLPGGFVEDPKIYGNQNGGAGFLSTGFSSITTESFTMTICRHFGSGAVTDARFSVQAIGKWK